MPASTLTQRPAGPADVDESMEAPYAANMGVYVFKKAVLQDLLSRQFPDAIDFSRDVLGPACHSLDIRAFQFKGYWRDVGSLKSYYDASMDLIKDHSAVSRSCAVTL
jgi:glucose-1-phosphate adenylyltransferase